MTTHEDIIRKIQGLLAKAEGTDNEHEAAAFMGKAQDLMRQHAVDQALLAKADPNRRTKPITKTIDFGKNVTGIKAKRALIGFIGSVNRCNVWMTGGRRYIVVAGFEEDVEFVEMLYRSIELQMEAAVLPAFNEYRANFGTAGKASFKTNFFYGYVGRVGERLREAAAANERAQAEAERAAGSTSTALVLVERKAEVDAITPTLRKGAGARHQGDRAASAAGRAAGGRADVSGGRGQVRGNAGALGR